MIFKGSRYEKAPIVEVTDPQGPASSEGRILRGGAWGEHPNNMRSACRNCIGPDGRHNGTGLRCVLLPEAAGQQRDRRQ